MWFNNLYLFQLPENFSLDLETLEQAMRQDRFSPCTNNQATSLGWYPPVGDEDQPLSFQIGRDYTMVCARREDRLLPGSVIKDTLDERVALIEEREQREVGRKEQKRLKDEIIFELLPRAFTKSSLQLAYVDVPGRRLVVNSSSAGRAEDLVSLLRQSLGSLPARPLQVQESVRKVMTGWLTGSALPAGFSLGDECELRDPADDASVVRCKGQDLTGDEIRVHLEAGKEVARLALDWRERLTFLLADDLSIKRLRFSELVEEEMDDADDDPITRFAADFSLMAMENSKFLDELAAAFGGLA